MGFPRGQRSAHSARQIHISLLSRRTKRPCYGTCWENPEISAPEIGIYGPIFRGCGLAWLNDADRKARATKLINMLGWDSRQSEPQRWARTLYIYQVDRIRKVNI